MTDLEQQALEELVALKAVFAQKMPGVKKVEITGVWVWVDFDGKPDVTVRNQLIEEKFRWAPKKKRWYWAGKRSSGRGKDMSYIRSKYGSVHIIDTE